MPWSGVQRGGFVGSVGGSTACRRIARRDLNMKRETAGARMIPCGETVSSAGALMNRLEPLIQLAWKTVNPS